MTIRVQGPFFLVQAVGSSSRGIGVAECLVGVSAVWPEGREWQGSSGRLGKGAEWGESPTPFPVEAACLICP